MTVEQILACEIPEGMYQRGLEILKSQIDEDKNMWDSPDDVQSQVSLCAAFTTLWELANGGIIIHPTMEDMTVEKDQTFIAGKQEGYQKAILDALQVVSEMLKLKVNVNVFGENVDATIIMRPILEEVDKRIKSLLPSPASDYVKVSEVQEIVDSVASNYPESIFSEPHFGGDYPPDTYTAAGCRLACKNIKVELEKRRLDALEGK